MGRGLQVFVVYGHDLMENAEINYTGPRNVTLGARGEVVVKLYISQLVAV